ncbi:hypothetical protein NC653_018389 [Populus alba x Populus x berolinensis]|uniref:B box-type domain-containing protein n=1 Tax=Populus alba x Populus x berolinensis TaxID=444605 RepID=A0AAD6VV45_9ROSI|nr:hypothetical protein NC653_018389 [Populus alba x Populus x berolinensis]
MRTLCDACESAAAIVFCAADEAALCLACDEKVHMCNKLASRHVRVGLANPSDVPRCDICENAPAFFYCETDGSSLCLQCDMNVHVGGKRTHGRYLLLRQRVEFAGDKPQPDDLHSQPMHPGETRKGQNQPPKATAEEKRQNRLVSPAPMSLTNSDGHDKVDKNMIDLNMKPQRTDHEQASNNQDHDKFPQRYYEFLDYFRIPDGPIFLEICGESSCNGIVNDYISVLAKKFGAAVVSLEHRYYGRSMPFKSTTTENLRFLSSKQALFDLAVFRQYYQASCRAMSSTFSSHQILVIGYMNLVLSCLYEDVWNDSTIHMQESLNLKLNRTSVENPWFVFGGSYAGALSAWFRLKFPHLTCGSLASSAVVLAIHNFTEFDQQIGESAGAECKATLQETTQLVEERLASNKQAVKTLFDAAELEIDGDFLYFLADAAVIAFQYGNPDIVCSTLVKAKNNGDDLVEAYAKYVKEYYLGTFGSTVQTYNQKYLKDTSLNKHTGDRLWWFQVCTEVAYFQVAPSNDSIRSSKVDARYHLDLCKNVFGEGIYPEVDVTNIYYGGTNISGSKIVFANGSQDPWRHASKQTSSPDMPSFLISCHNCGHCTDIRGCPQTPLSLEGNARNCSSPEAVEKVRHQIIEKMDLWLSECRAGSWSSM